MGVVGVGEVERRGQSCARFCSVIDAIRILAGYRGCWESLIKSIDDSKYLMQVCGLLIEIQFFNLCWVILSDSDLTVYHSLGNFEY